jgi:thiol-disulfide isomerase/thioredoxin
MLRYFLLLAIFSLFFSFLFSQDSSEASTSQEGIKFESKLSWNEIKAKARSADKYIFLDCYATWCAPCKYMDAAIYPLKEVGDFFNKNFLNVKVQMDRTDKDNPTVIDWYSDAAELRGKYKVNVFPTFLIFSPQGELVHRIIGISATGKQFIFLASNGLKSSTQYYTQLKNWQQNIQDTAYIKSALTNAIALSDTVNIKEINREFISILKNKDFNEEQAILIVQATFSKSDAGFNFLLEHIEKIKSMKNARVVILHKLARIVFEAEISIYMNTPFSSVNWAMLSDKLKKDYPNCGTEFNTHIESLFKEQVTSEIRRMYASFNNEPNEKEIRAHFIKRFPGYDFTQIQLEAAVLYYESKQYWNKCEIAAQKLLEQYKSNLLPDQINDVCWFYIFLNGQKKQSLQTAIQAMSKVIVTKPNGQNLDTYANLLYKSGDVKLALDWEKKAEMTVINEPTKANLLKEIRENLGKMESGRKTWIKDLQN